MAVTGNLSMTSPIGVGEVAPDFVLKDQDQRDVRLKEFYGNRSVVLAFYPLDWSPVCTGENRCLSDDFSKFGELNAEVLGISTDSFFSHKAWADSLGLRHRLLSDYNREVVKKYGVYFEPLNCGKRATVIIDINGKVAYSKVHELGSARDDREIIEVLTRLSQDKKSRTLWFIRNTTRAHPEYALLLVFLFLALAAISYVPCNPVRGDGVVLPWVESYAFLWAFDSYCHPDIARIGLTLGALTVCLGIGIVVLLAYRKGKALAARSDP